MYQIGKSDERVLDMSNVGGSGGADVKYKPEGYNSADDRRFRVQNPTGLSKTRPDRRKRGEGLKGRRGRTREQHTCRARALDKVRGEN